MDESTVYTVALAFLITFGAPPGVLIYMVVFALIAYYKDFKRDKLF